MKAEKPLEFKAVTWAEVNQLLLTLAEGITQDGFRPDFIVAVSRGGFVPARIFSDLLGGVELASVGVRYYVAPGRRGKAPQITHPLSVPLEGARVLVVDDVADSGKTLRAVVKHLQGRGAESVRVGVLYKKPWSSLKPDYYGGETRVWVVFPWEQHEFAQSLIQTIVSEGRSLEEAKQHLLKKGLDPSAIEKVGVRSPRSRTSSPKSGEPAPE